MNLTTDNTTLISCDFAYLPINPAKISPDRPAVFIVRLVVNALNCSFIILLNILVMVAVKTKQQLRTKSNVALACLATTDLVVGLVVQPLHIASLTFILKGEKEVRRNEKQVTANQVSLEAKEKILKNKKTFYKTTIVLVVILMTDIPARCCAIIFISFKNSIPAQIRHVIFSLVILLPVLNSLLNPLIYAVRMRYFRVAFIQLLSRKTVAQAEELERKIFRPRQIGVIANVERGQNRASREEDEQQGNETLNNGHETTVRTQPQEEYEEKPL
ncbi:hypothetical protein ACROYT_G033746 [Oculina patagonica]